jgi:hypothetical protein
MQKESEQSPFKESKLLPVERLNKRISVAGAATQYKTTKLLSNE